MIKANEGQESRLLHRAEQQKLVDYSTMAQAERTQLVWLRSHVHSIISSTAWDLLEWEKNSLKKEALSLKES